MTINVSLFLNLKGEVVALKAGHFGEKLVVDPTTFYPNRTFVLVDLGGTSTIEGTSHPLTVHVYKEVERIHRCPTCNQILKEPRDG